MNSGFKTYLIILLSPCTHHKLSDTRAAGFHSLGLQQNSSQMLKLLCEVCIVGLFQQTLFDATPETGRVEFVLLVLVLYATTWGPAVLGNMFFSIQGLLGAVFL